MVELLAPAGNMEALKGAFCAGADAVYLGGSRFGARAYADNFTNEELIHGIRYAHLLGKRIYLTVNTLVKQNELQELYEYLRPFYESGLDGVIVQDIGVFSCIRQWFPEMELHASTQMTITGVYGAELIKKLGAVRIVPARELNLHEITYIKEKTGLQIETFIHGAMCYCYSGQCLFSSILGGRSGNRGRCAQPCRLPYRVTIDGNLSKECYPLSMKDLCTIERIPELIRAGIDSFKIEGRMKKPEYVAGVTAVYRKYIDLFYEHEAAKDQNAYDWKIEQEDRELLSSLYIRTGIEEGYYHRKNGREMITMESPAYRATDDGILGEIRRRYLADIKRLPVLIRASFLTGAESRLELSAEGVTISLQGETVQKAQKVPVAKGELKERLSKLGETVFSAAEVFVEVSDDAFYPVGKVNALRREACRMLEEALLKNKVRRQTESNTPKVIAENRKMTGKKSDSVAAVLVRTKEQLEAVSEYSFFSRIYTDGGLVLSSGPVIKEFLNSYAADGGEVVLSFPYIIRENDLAELEKIYELAVKEECVSGIQIRSLEGLGFLSEKKFQKKVYADAGFYCFNLWSMEVFSDRISCFCMPYELNYHEQKSLLSAFACEKVVYGRIPMMITANCVAKTTGRCRKKEGAKGFLTDRYNVNFPVLCDCSHCMNIIYNSVPLSLHGNLKEILAKADIRLDFTVESASECRKVMSFFEDMLTMEPGDCERIPPYQKFTSGHEKRGVE